MLIQYKKKSSFKEKLLPNFLKIYTAPEFYEFRCNVDEKGQIDSPISLKWDPVFSYLDREKTIWSFNCSAIYDPKYNKVSVLNFNQLATYQSRSFEPSKISSVKY